MANNKINKNIVPEGFTISLALVDLLPVIFFGLAFLMLGILLEDTLVYIGTILCTISGLIKVLWKIIVVIKKKNIWWMFLQMRIGMPIGFILILIGIIYSVITKDLSYLCASIFNIYSIIFYILGVIGMTLMIVFSINLDSTDVKSNWLEQAVNGLAQAFFFIGFLIAFLIR